MTTPTLFASAVPAIKANRNVVRDGISALREIKDRLDDLEIINRDVLAAITAEDEEALESALTVARARLVELRDDAFPRVASAIGAVATALSGDASTLVDALIADVPAPDPEPQQPEP